MSTEEGRPSTPAGSGVIDDTGHGGSRRMSHFKEYKFFRSFSAKVENWPMRKAEALWRRMRERKIAGETRASVDVMHVIIGNNRFEEECD
ncbi:hypothetical protein WH47_06609 [Habropoda laboriosa]|uniref:Uncharacterized protein n=1 Tax=Habropoda laboriosa TaxID=597456 RepID=A0A0L7QRB3_9HYME|nr:hypothetical protein WH47_06609 [Habropoda laboriosa]